MMLIPCVLNGVEPDGKFRSDLQVISSWLNFARRTRRTMLTEQTTRPMEKIQVRMSF